jgi:hypothetical protein
MLKYVLLAGAMTFAAPALAQDAKSGQQTAPGAEQMSTQSGGDATTTSAVPATPQPATPVDEAMRSSQAATSQAPSAPTGAPPAQSASQQAPADPAAAPSAQAAAPTAPADPAAQPSAQASAQPISGPDQIAQVVSTEFPSYDKDASGTLNATEFASWMVALKKASDPTTKAESAEVKTWVNQAFASADKDKNKAVSKTELTGFLTQGA